MEILFSAEELSLLSNAFSAYFAIIKQQGAVSNDLKIIRDILLKTGTDRDNEYFAILLAKLDLLLNEENLAPDLLTLSEAAHFYNVNSATLRRACWTHELPGEKRGKAWIVSSSDLERYLAKRKTKGHRK